MYLLVNGCFSGLAGLCFCNGMVDQGGLNGLV